MDKYEYRIRLQEINTLISTRNFQDAAGVADGIDWQRVKSSDTLCRISDVYKINKEYAKSRRLLVLANQRDPQNPEIIYSLCELTLFLYGRDGLQSDLTSALTLMQNYNILQPQSPKRLILQYKMYQVSPVSLDERIDVLQRLKQESYQPRWVYELAVLYHEAGRSEEAIAECRDIMNNGGKYAARAEQLLRQIEAEPKKKAASQDPSQEDIPTVENGKKQDTDAALQRTVAEGLAQLGESSEADGQDEAPAPEENDTPAPEPRQETEQESTEEEQEEEHAEESTDEAAPSAATMSISEVMAEWEKIRQSVRDSSEEKVAEKIRQDTGELFHEFDETSRHGLLEDIEKNVEKRHRDARASLENGIEGRGSQRYRGAGAQEAPGKQGSYQVHRIHTPEAVPQEEALQEDLFANEAPEQEAYYEETADAGENAAEEPVPAPEAACETYAQEQGDADAEEAERAEDPCTGENSAYPEDAEEEPAYEEEPDYGTAAAPEDGEEPAYEENEDGSISTRRWNADAVRVAMDREKKRYEEFEAREKNHAKEPAPVTEPEQAAEEETPAEEEIPESVQEAQEEAPEEQTPAEEAAEEAGEPQTPPVLPRRRRRPVRPAASFAEPAPEEVPDAGQALSEEEDGFPGEPAPEEELTPAEEARQLHSRRRRTRPVRRPAEELRRQMELEEEAPEETAPEEETVPENMLPQEEQAPAAEEAEEEAPAEEAQSAEAPREEKAAERATRALRHSRPIRREEAKKETAPAAPQDARPLAASGQRALTESEKKLFGPTCIVPENRRQIVNAIDSLSLASYTGNILVTGPEGAAKKVAAGILEITKHSDSNFTGRIAKASGPALNRLSPEKLGATLNQINGGAMIVYNASALEEETLKNLHSEIEGKERGLIVIFADRKRAMDTFLQEYPDYLKSFTVTVDIQPLTDKALVSYGLEYAKSKDYSIDELGQLALSSRISSRQTPDHQVTTKEVRDLVDEAIGWASKKNLHTLMLILSRKRYDQDDRIIIHEKDFQHYEK